MAKLTNAQLVNECKRMAGADSAVEKKSGGITYYRKRYGYVLGGQGETYTKQLAEKWGNAKRVGKSKNYFTKDCYRWIGRRVVDCSGMIVEAIRAYAPDYGDRTANYFYTNCCTERGGIKTLPELAGTIVWKKGHIGVYIGGGLVIEARGYKYGVVVSQLSTQRWTNWGKLEDIVYTATTKAQPVFTRELKYKSPMMRGDDVKVLQTLLAAAEESTGAVDGIFGKKTRQAVKSFQRGHNLKADGIAGEKTISTLGGVWRG